MFAKAGWCRFCGAIDVLFARDVESGSLFYVCAACSNAGSTIDDCDEKITEARELAPNGWTLASHREVCAAGLEDRITAEASGEYVNLIEHFPGFRTPIW